MATKSSSKTFSDLLRKSTIMSDNIKLNAEKIGRFGLDLPEFTNQMDVNVSEADVTNKEHERLRSLLKSKTDELDLLKAKLKEDYSKAKKTVKLAEPQVNWVAYGIEDKK